MTEMTTFEERVARMIDAYARRARVDVDPAEITRVAMAQPASTWLPNARRPAWSLSYVALAVVVAITALVGSVAGGAWTFHPNPTLDLAHRVVVPPFGGLPPAGATPSTPESGQLVVKFDGRTSEGFGSTNYHHVWVLEDGRLIRKVENGPVGVVEQLLSPDGVERIRAEVLRSATKLTPIDPEAAVAVPRGRPGLMWGSIRLVTGSTLYDVDWQHSRLPWALADLGSWLPASAWLDPRIGGFVAARYALCATHEAEPTVPMPVASDPKVAMDHLPGDLSAAIRRFGVAISPAGFEGSACFEMSTEAAREIAAMKPNFDERFGEFVFWEPDGSATFLKMRPIAPNGEMVCVCA